MFRHFLAVGLKFRARAFKLPFKPGAKQVYNSVGHHRSFVFHSGL